MINTKGSRPRGWSLSWGNADASTAASSGRRPKHRLHFVSSLTSPSIMLFPVPIHRIYSSDLNWPETRRLAADQPLPPASPLSRLISTVDGAWYPRLPSLPGGAANDNMTYSIYEEYIVILFSIPFSRYAVLLPYFGLFAAATFSAQLSPSTRGQTWFISGGGECRNRVGVYLKISLYEVQLMCVSHSITVASRLGDLFAVKCLFYKLWRRAHYNSGSS